MLIAPLNHFCIHFVACCLFGGYGKINPWCRAQTFSHVWTYFRSYLFVASLLTLWLHIYIFVLVGNDRSIHFSSPNTTPGPFAPLSCCTACIPCFPSPIIHTGSKRPPFLSRSPIWSFFLFLLFNTTILQAIIMQFVSEVATGGAKGGKYLDPKLSRLSTVYKKCCHLRYSDLWNRCASQNCWTSKCEIVVLLGMSFITRWAKEKQILINATVMQLTEEPKQPKLGWLLEKNWVSRGFASTVFFWWENGC